MAHVALYRQFRPVTFDEIVEQKHAVTALRQSVISGQVGHAYLFCGTRGTGKTTIAKIFSRAINCLSPRNGNPCNECEICRGILDNTLMDVIEMDAASNNSVDNIRRVCDEVMFLPSRSKYKVYIIDEVHMLSGGAFNALLKTLEEPPAHAVFILATTEPHRIPATIISRCQRYDFRRIPMESMIARLREIADVQQVAINHDALVTISNLSDGALRDAISLLDQVSTGVERTITRDDVLRITGVVDDAFLYAMSNALLTGSYADIVTLTEQLVMDGRDIIRFTLDLAHYFRDLMVIRVTPDPENLVQATSDSMVQMQELAARTPAETLVFAITRLSGLVSELKWSPDMRTSFEIALLSFGAGERGFGKPESAPLLTVKPAAPVMPRSVPNPAASPAPVPVPAAPVSPVREPAVPNPDLRMNIFGTVPEINRAAETTAAKSRAYMPPPPIEDMFTSAFMQTETAKAASDVKSKADTSVLTPMESSLEAPPEDESYLPPPPFESYLPPPAESVIHAFTKEEDQIPAAPVVFENQLTMLSDDSLMNPLTDESLHNQASGKEENLLLEPADEASSDSDPADNSLEDTDSGLPLSELWAALLHKWEDTLFSDVLLLKQASVYEKDRTFYIVFPDHMQAYANSLTQLADYKKISKDIQMVVSGISSVEVLTESVRDGLSDPGKAQRQTAANAPAQPEWVAQMLAFSEATGIPVETLDKL